MNKLNYVKLDIHVKRWLNSVLPKRMDKQELHFSGKYVRVHDNKISYDCIDDIDKTIHKKISLQQLAAWYYDAPRLTPISYTKPVVVEKNVPIPVRNSHYSILPFHQMEVGDSFFIDRERFKSTSLLQLRGYLYSLSRRYVIDNYVSDRFCFSVDRTNKGVRCFRIE